MDILDDVVQYAKSIGLMVILDDHFAIARSAKETSKNVVRRSTKSNLAVPVQGISQQQWISDWVGLTNHFINDQNVVGFDLFNEPHTQFVKGKWSLTDYLTDGATWGPCTAKLCGKKASLLQSSSDWPTWAEAAGDAILAVNPHLLMFVEGVQLYPAPNMKSGVEPYWWGSILKGVATDPIKFVVGGSPVTNQLVYSPHEFGPWKCCGLANEFNYNTSYKSIAKVFSQNWAYILNSKTSGVEAPIWLGEFNTCNAPEPHDKYSPVPTAAKCIANTKHGSQGQWFQIMIQYLKANPEIGWSYYPLNATNALDQRSNNSLLGCPFGKHAPCTDPWHQVRLPGLLTDLKTIETP
jgi:endoglucanase